MKKYFIFLPLMASCNGLSQSNNVIEDQVQGNQAKHAGNVNQNIDMNSLYELCKKGDAEGVKICLKDPDILEKIRGDDGFQALSEAMCNKHESIAILLYEKGAGEYFMDNDQNYKSLLHGAAKYNFIILTDLLSSHPNADVNNFFANLRYTPLHVAVKNGHHVVCYVLLKNGADVNFKGQHSITPLYLAVREGHKGIASQLLDKGADPNIIVRQSQNTPLALAIQKGDKSMVALLLNKGADPNIVEWKPGITLLDLALQIDNQGIVDLLLEKGAKRGTHSAE